MASCKVESRLTIEKLPKMVTTLTQKVDFLLSAVEELQQEKEISKNTPTIRESVKISKEDCLRNETEIQTRKPEWIVPSLPFPQEPKEKVHT